MIEGLIAIEKSARQAEFRKRNRPYDEKMVTPGAVADFEPQGWIVHSTNKTGVKLRKQRSAAEQLENRFWCCLYRLGYNELNVGRNFRIQVAAQAKPVAKQIDVFARDEETIIIAECKTAEELKKKPLQKELGELDSLKKSISDVLRKHYGSAFKPKIIWCFVTDKIEWTDNDLARAKQLKIEVITERELDYIEEISKILGNAARHQFKAEYLSGQKIPALDDRKVPAVKIRLGGEPAYVFSARADEIIRISFVNHRDLRDPRGAPSYQRLVNPGRLRKIGEFLLGGGYFPNTILLNFHRKPRFDLSLRSDDKDIQFGYLYLPDTYKSCWVIDGQHRLYGCAVLPEEHQSPTLMFVAFECIDVTEEAHLFATINREQQKVQKRLLDELDGDLKWDSDDPSDRIAAVASRAIDLMNTRFGGPFEDRVISPGLKTSDDRPLTLPEVRKAIISAGLIGRVSGKDRVLVPGPCYHKTNEQSMTRLMDLLTWYFDVIREANPARWEDPKGRLCNNFGVPGHIRLLAELIRHVEQDQSVDARELQPKYLFKSLEPLVAPVLKFITETNDAEFAERFKVTLGSGGVKQYYFALVHLIHDTNKAFVPSGFEDFVQQTTKSEQEQADKDVKWIQARVHQLVVDKLRDRYGDDFFESGITNKEIQARAYQKRLEDEPGQRGDLAMYLDFVDLRKIVEQSDHWPTFENELNIPLPNQKKGLAKYVKWFDEINRIRRIPAHPYKRAYSRADLQILKLISTHLSSSEPTRDEVLA
ncbi:DGQHR domain-containing protein [Hyphomicrobium sp.]|uniref:DGQHR domain-containing protein n=1 Tax=Hyphomicrobium sp. TaxID=82 RepID=UPI0035614EC2